MVLISAGKSEGVSIVLFHLGHIATSIKPSDLTEIGSTDDQAEQAIRTTSAISSSISGNLVEGRMAR